MRIFAPLLSIPEDPSEDVGDGSDTENDIIGGVHHGEDMGAYWDVERGKACGQQFSLMGDDDEDEVGQNQRVAAAYDDYLERDRSQNSDENKENRMDSDTGMFFKSRHAIM